MNRHNNKTTRLSWFYISAVAVSIVFFCGCHEEYPAAPMYERDTAWASPEPSRVGIPNFFRVGQKLYRGGRPTENGYLLLKKSGIDTVISLQFFHNSRRQAEQVGLNYIRIPFNAWHLSEKKIRRFLEAATSPENGVVYVHCKYGSDRTGMMVAAYRIAAQGWTLEKALDEMRRGGFGFHSQWGNITRFLEKVNWKEMKH